MVQSTLFIPTRYNDKICSNAFVLLLFLHEKIIAILYVTYRYSLEVPQWVPITHIFMEKPEKLQYLLVEKRALSRAIRSI